MRYENKVFEDQTIRLDGNEYIGCTFRRCELQFGASAPISLVNNSFGEQVTWSFTDAAAMTIQFMTGLYLGADQGGRKLIENTFDNIRRGQPPQTPGAYTFNLN